MFMAMGMQLVVSGVVTRSLFLEGGSGPLFLREREGEWYEEENWIKK